MKRALSPTDSNPAPPAKRLKLSANIGDADSSDNKTLNTSPNHSAATRSDTSPFFKGGSQPSQSPFKPKSFNLSYSSTPVKKLGNISLQTSSGQTPSTPNGVANAPKNSALITGDVKNVINTNGSGNQDIDEQVRLIMQDITPDMLEDDYQAPADPVPQPPPVVPKKKQNDANTSSDNVKMKQAKLDFSKAKPKASPAAKAKTPTPVKQAPKVEQRSAEHDEERDEQEDEDEEDEDDQKGLSKSGNKMLEKFHDMSVKERRRAQKQETWKQKNKHKYAFLEQIMDENKNLKGSPGYDPRTLYIPAQAYANMTPFEKQYWDIKRNHFDTVIFFKKGMFYELFETDAEIGHRELDLKMTDRVNMRMVGLPAKHFTHWAAKLIALGYKVAKVEQLETPLAMAKRQGIKGARDVKDVVLKRELTLIMTPATIVDESLLSTPQATFLLALKEDIERIHYGICLVDTATGEFKLGHFQDDKARTQLQTMLFQTRPREVVFEKSALSPVTMKLLRQQLSHVIFTPLPAKQCWDAQTTLDKLTFEPYFYQGTVTDYDKVKDDWPVVIKQLKDSTHAMAALGTCIAYLNELKLDQQLVSLKNFSEYNVLGETEHLILDGKSLFNLEVVENNHDLTAAGTLLHVIDDCRTAFGKRLLKQWLCHPLKDIDAINDRLNAVTDLMTAADLADNLRKNMKRLPDLQRTISRIHAGHVTLAEFVTVLDAFEHIHTFMTEIESHVEEFSSVTLRHITKLGEGMPTFGDELQRICSSFDRTSAMTTGRISPNAGFAPEYDTAVSHVTEFEQQLTAHLKVQQAHFKSTKVTFKDIGKDLYLIEVPTEVLNKIAKPSGYISRGATAKVQRFYTDTITEILPKLAEAKEELAAAEAGLLQTYLKAFDAHYTRWSRVLDCLAELDCLLSLASCSSKSNTCRPQFIDPDSVSGPVLDIENLRHPCLVESMPDTFIPNSIKLGSGEPLVVLLTGPNMGGKSTILRQTSIAVIMAQIGCYVFADKCVMTPVDRIFTRIGAQDHIFEGQSTFMVELIEAGLVLHQATQHSLVILDELGRGTSTFDGYSLAYAVLKYISEMIGCRTLFSTHYHMLTDEFKDNAAVSLHHMKCITDPTLNKITFLYQMDRGVCPKSYGMNVAHMANLPLQVIQAAEIKAKSFEEASQLGHYKNYTRMKAQSIRLTASLQTLYETLSSNDDTKLKRLWQDLNERK